jgi:hypothetical protein
MVHRLDTGGSPAQFLTWRGTAPIPTHWRPAVCEEVECRPHQNGWVTILPAGSDAERLLRRTCQGLVDGHHRHYVEKPGDAGLLEFHFEPGQACFRVTLHKVRIERPELYVVYRGDWRRNMETLRRYDRPDQFVDDFDRHIDKLRHQ